MLLGLELLATWAADEDLILSGFRQGVKGIGLRMRIWVLF